MKGKYLLSNLITGVVVGGMMIYFQDIKNNTSSEENDTIALGSIIPLKSSVNHAEESTNNSNFNPPGNVDLTSASEKSVQAVVHITTEFTREEITYDPLLRLFYGEEAYRIRERHGKASGSGVIISPNGYIVTNNHVVQDAHTVFVNLGSKKYNAKIVGTDPSTDIAVLKIEENELAYLEFGNSDNLKLGEWVIAVGNPLNLQTTVTAGIVSAKNRNIDLLTQNYNPDENVFPVESFIQTDAAVNSGNSGGALVNTSGKLIGINTAIASGNGFYTGYSFAIPANIVKKVTTDLIQFGEVKRVMLGVNLADNNSELAKFNELTIDNGVVITNIFENSPAAKAQLEVKDIILGLNGENINSVAAFQEKMTVLQPGETVIIDILRGKERKQIQVKL